jgi:hypothetical protein
MAIDKAIDSTQLDSDLTSVANAIRAKSGGSGQLAFPAGFVSEIQAIPSGGGVGVETLDYVIDNARDMAMLFPVSIDVLSADNIIVTAAVKETGKYENGVLTMDQTPTIYPTPDGIDFVATGFLFNSAQKFNGQTYNSSNGTYYVYTNAFPTGNAGFCYRNNSTQGGGVQSSATALNIENGKLKFKCPVRSFSQAGYYLKFAIKVYYWND